jgi:hypothetical protein
MGSLHESRRKYQQAFAYYVRSCGFADGLARSEISLAELYWRFDQGNQARDRVRLAKAMASPESTLARALRELENRMTQGDGKRTRIDARGAADFIALLRRLWRSRRPPRSHAYFFRLRDGNGPRHPRASPPRVPPTSPSARLSFRESNLNSYTESRRDRVGHLRFRESRGYRNHAKKRAIDDG